jgi:hypothetical protein
MSNTFFYNAMAKICLLLLCFCMLTPTPGRTAQQSPLETADAPFDPNRYLSDPLLEDLFKEKDLDPDKDAFSLASYYDAMEPPDQDGMMGRYSALAEDSFYFLVPALTVLGVLYVMPESVTNWNRDEINWEEGSEKWKNNVTSWQWDEDDAWINYIGHPYFGSTYFIHARHYGYSRLESLGFSFAISSFYELGLEAWAEPVSIQDMIFTPLLGWGVAEILLPIEHHILTNNKEILNSRILGSTALFLIDPFGHIVPPIKKFTDSLFSSDTQVQITPTYSKSTRLTSEQGQSQHEERFALQLTVQW